MQLKLLLLLSSPVPIWLPAVASPVCTVPQRGGSTMQQNQCSRQHQGTEQLSKSQLPGLPTAHIGCALLNPAVRPQQFLGSNRDAAHRNPVSSSTGCSAASLQLRSTSPAVPRQLTRCSAAARWRHPCSRGSSPAGAPAPVARPSSRAAPLPLHWHLQWWSPGAPCC